MIDYSGIRRAHDRRPSISGTCPRSATERLSNAIPKGTSVNTWIVLFLLFGAAFGLASFSNRHLFSEGPTQADPGPALASAGSRIFWLLVCTFLWPIMLLAGLNSARILARRRRQQAATSGS